MCLAQCHVEKATTASGFVDLLDINYPFHSPVRYSYSTLRWFRGSQPVKSVSRGSSGQSYRRGSEESSRAKMWIQYERRLRLANTHHPCADSVGRSHQSAPPASEYVFPSRFDAIFIHPGTIGSFLQGKQNQVPPRLGDMALALASHRHQPLASRTSYITSSIDHFLIANLCNEARGWRKLLSFFHSSLTAKPSASLLISDLPSLQTYVCKSTAKECLEQHTRPLLSTLAFGPTGLKAGSTVRP